MSMLQSVLQWAETLPKWQSDAVRRILTQNELTDKDKLELLCMLKEKHRLPDPLNPPPKPCPLQKGQVSGLPCTPSQITLKAMTIVSGVNAIPDESTLPFGHKGLTVIYGENGSGKSGYARVLKKACKARDTNEHILPNAFLPKSSGPARARFKVSVDDAPDTDIDWLDGDEADPILSCICVFDSKCARVIIDEKNELVYLPYGAHVFEALVALLQNLRATLEAERPKPNRPLFPEMLPTTEAAKFIAALSRHTTNDDIAKAATWVDTDDTTLTQLNARIAEAELHDPHQQARRILNFKSRLDSLLETFIAIDAAISPTQEEELSKAIKDLKVSKKALALASEETLSNEPLPAVGEEAWQRLYNAARAYSTQAAYPGKEFPVLDDASLCVLCMQPFSSVAKQRMQRFKDFMEKTAKKQADAASDRLAEITNQVQAISVPNPDTYKDVLDEIGIRAPSLPQHLVHFLQQAALRLATMIKAAEDQQVSSLPELSPPPLECIVLLATQLETEAADILKTADPQSLAQLKAQRAELSARKMLHDKRKELQQYVAELQTAHKYDLCIKATDSKDITMAGKQLVIGTLTTDLQNALNDELRAMNMAYIRLQLKPSGTKGETLHKIELVGCHNPEKFNLSQLLSEGEQTVLAIAGFLAELNVTAAKSPIVFDDPVCSLDHRYREKIADRLVHQAKARQIIVFTHDIVFLLALQTKAEELHAFFLPLTVERSLNVPGKCTPDVPWHAMNVKQRLAHLSKSIDDFQGLYAENPKLYNSEAIRFYGLLRQTWEASIEEILLHRTVRRHVPAIQTQELRYVTVEDKDYTQIYQAMTKCSKWADHDLSKALDVNLPDPKELRDDIITLTAFAKTLSQRAQGTEERRKTNLKPPLPSAG